jgi:putative hemolysin
MTVPGTQMLINQLVVLFVLLLLSGFFSSAETALFSISKAKAVHLAKEKGLVNSLIKKMKDDHHRLLSTILIGNNIVNVGASALATAVTMKMVSHNAVGIATGIMTFLILIFGEINRYQEQYSHCQTGHHSIVLVVDSICSNHFHVELHP